MPRLILTCLLLLTAALPAAAQTFHNNGIALHQLTDGIIKKYDQNRDSRLDVAGESFLRQQIGDPGKEVIRTESRGLLFTDADQAGNKDGWVSETELYDFLSTFDEDNDGELTAYKNIFYSLFGGPSEWEKFEDRYQEKFSYKAR